MRPAPSRLCNGDLLRREFARLARVTWLFGYGSLVWRPAMPFRQRRPGSITGWSRRFWQRSPDHRGTPEAPGRVVTLIAAPGERCFGMAYQIDGGVIEDFLTQLDYRERAGYERLTERVTFADGAGADALVYIAGPGNPNFTGDRPLEEIAAIVHASSGPSGSNREYVIELAQALRAMDADDAHLFALDDLVRSYSLSQ